MCFSCDGRGKKIVVSGVGSICLCPKPHELETLIIRGLLRRERSVTDSISESNVVSQFLTFCYLLSLHLKHPESALFFTKALHAEKASDAPTSDSILTEDLPQFLAYKSQGACSLSQEGLQRVDSWDVIRVFQAAGAPDPRNVSFP